MMSGVVDLADFLAKALAPPDAAGRRWKPHFRWLSNDLMSETAISESPCRATKQDGGKAEGGRKWNDS
jgi:hypothetical protein